MAAVVSQTSDLWIPCLSRSPALAAVASTCLRKGLPLPTIPRALDGKTRDSVKHCQADVQSVARLPSTLGYPALVNDQDLVCADDGGQPLIHKYTA